MNLYEKLVKKEEKNNVNDNVGEVESSLRREILQEVTEYKLSIIQHFMFGGPNKNFGDCTVFINPAIRQIERFTYIWFNELSEESRKIIINFCIGDDNDTRSRDYKDYLNSPIWKYSSSIIKLVKGYTCERCSQQSNPTHLVVHHKTYAHLGSELYHLSDVELLCTDCHMKVHGIERGCK